MTAPMRPDSELNDFDIPAAVRARVFSGDAAIAAALRLEAQGVGPYPVRFLAGYVRSAGRGAALALPEPLVGDVPRALAREWLTASLEVDPDSLDDDLAFATWLEMVAALLELRRTVTR